MQTHQTLLQSIVKVKQTHDWVAVKQNHGNLQKNWT